MHGVLVEALSLSREFEVEFRVRIKVFNSLLGSTTAVVLV